jgi:hypothetical protein
MPLEAERGRTLGGEVCVTRRPSFLRDDDFDIGDFDMSVLCERWSEVGGMCHGGGGDCEDLSNWALYSGSSVKSQETKRGLNIL